MPIQLTVQHLQYMGMGRRYWEAEIENLSVAQRQSMQPYLDKVPEHIKQGRGVYLWGENGAGKTYIGAALCKHVWSEYRVQSYLVAATDLYEAWKAPSTPAGPDSTETLVHRASTARFLVVDDLGREYRTASGFSEVQFGQLLRNRTRALLTTVITTNLAPRQFSEVYGKAAGDLAKEAFMIVQVKDGGHRNRRMA